MSKEFAEKSYEQRETLGQELWLALQSMDYESLAACAAVVRSKGSLSQDLAVRSAEVKAAMDWACRVWFESHCLALYLRGFLTVSGSDPEDLSIHCDLGKLPVDTPPEFGKLMKIGMSH
jgi:hypothetical protein